MEFEEPLQDRQQWSIGGACSMSRVLELLSTKTAFQVVRELFFGTTRFEDFVDRIGTSAPAVSRALKQLESAEIVTRVPYREPGRRARDEYRLTCCRCSSRWCSGATHTFSPNRCPCHLSMPTPAKLSAYA